MKKRTKEEMKEYQRKRRKGVTKGVTKVLQNNVTPTEVPVIPVTPLPNSPDGRFHLRSFSKEEQVGRKGKKDVTFGKLKVKYGVKLP